MNNLDMGETSKIDALLDFLPLYSEDLGIDLSQPRGRFNLY